MKRTADDIRELIKSRLRTKDIVLWGTNSKARDFYEKYKEEFHIKRCLVNGEGFPEYLDKEKKIQVIRWEEYTGGERDFIVICEGPYAVAENQVTACGLKIFEEYADINIVNAVLTDKKIAIMAGACQSGVVCNFLTQLDGFREKYMLYRFSTHLWVSRWSVKSISYLKNFCDLYICMQHEEDNPMFFQPDELPDTCKVVMIPSALLRLYWPQMGRNWRGALNEYFRKDKNVPAHGPFEYKDININRMIDEGKGVEEIIECLTSDEFYSKKEVEEHVAMMLRMLDYEEDRCDIKISPYIRSNYKKKMLYRDMAHMQTCLVCEMMREILRYLHMDTNEVDEMERLMNNKTIQRYQSHCAEVPVYPSVAKYMNLNWWNKDILYNVNFYNGSRKITFEQYIRSYYSVCSKTKQILEEW